jgi:hypothetical protein
MVAIAFLSTLSGMKNNSGARNLHLNRFGKIL